MKSLLWVVVMPFIVFRPCAHADSILNINITYATAVMAPNDGSGDNVFFTLIGPGTTITGTGGMGCSSWCFGPIPDLSSVGVSEVFVGFFQSATIMGTTFDPQTLNLCCLFSFSGGLNPSANGFVGSGETFTLLNLTLPCCGVWSLNFSFFPADGASPAYYQFVNGSFTAGTPVVTPEPGMLGLMATGLAGIVGVIRGKRLIYQRRAKRIYFPIQDVLP